MARKSHISNPKAHNFARFMMMVKIPETMEECWIWEGGRPREKYGNFSLNGKTVLAHRWIYHEVVEEIPEGRIVLHNCDNPSCVNPLHLSAGTYKDNMDDMVSKGRDVKLRGADHPSSRITESDVIDIRKRAACGETCAAISRDYPLGRQQIDKIVRRVNWRHV